MKPAEPDRIVNPGFGTTDAGRILLEADLRIKKTVAELIHPDTTLGAQFWDAQEADSSGQICLSFRNWIVPEPAVVRETDDELYILDAPLEVNSRPSTCWRNRGAAAHPQRAHLIRESMSSSS